MLCKQNLETFSGVNKKRPFKQKYKSLKKLQ